MAQYEVQGPDGQIHIIEGPANATPAQIEAFASQNIPRASAAPAQSEGIPGARRTYSLAEVPVAAARNLPASAKQFGTGLYEAITQPVQTLGTILDIGAGALQKLTPESARQFIAKFDANPEAAQRAVQAAEQFGGMYKDRFGSYEAIKRTIAEDPVGAAADLSTLLTGGAGVARLGGAAGTAEALSKAATATNPLSAVTKPAQAALAAKERFLPSDLSKQQQINATRDALLSQAQSEGFKVTPGSVSPTGSNILAERIAGKTYLEQLMSVDNQAVADRLARRAVGLSETAPLTSEAMQKIRAAEYAKGYEPLAKLGNIPVDNAYLNDLVNIETKFKGASASFPGAVPDDVGKLIQNYTVGKFDAADAIDISRNLRRDAKANFKKGDDALASAQLDVSNALENQIERHLSAAGSPNAQAMLDQFRASRQRMAISHTIEDAILEGSGSIIPAKIARDIQSGKYLTGDLKLIGEFANVFPRVAQSPARIGTPSSGSVIGAGLGGAVGAGAGALMGGATGAGAGAGVGASLGAVAPQIVSGGMRAYLMSPVGQRRVAPQYDTFANRLVSDIAARNALLLQQTQPDNALAR